MASNCVTDSSELTVRSAPDLREGRPGRARKRLPGGFSFSGAERKALSRLAPHHAAVAERRLDCLRKFWEADMLAGGADRMGTRERIATLLTAENPEFPVSSNKLSRWEGVYRRRGMVGLAGIRGDRRIKRSVSGGVTDVPLPALLEQVAGLLLDLAKRLQATGTARQG